MGESGTTGSATVTKSLYCANVKYYERDPEKVICFPGSGECRTNEALGLAGEKEAGTFCVEASKVNPKEGQALLAAKLDEYKLFKGWFSLTQEPNAKPSSKYTMLPIVAKTAASYVERTQQKPPEPKRAECKTEKVLVDTVVTSGGTRNVYMTVERCPQDFVPRPAEGTNTGPTYVPEVDVVAGWHSIM